MSGGLRNLSSLHHATPLRGPVMCSWAAAATGCCEVLALRLPFLAGLPWGAHDPSRNIRRLDVPMSDANSSAQPPMHPQFQFPEIRFLSIEPSKKLHGNTRPP